MAIYFVTIVKVIIAFVALLSLLNSFVHSYSLFLSKWLPHKRCVLIISNYFPFHCENIVISVTNIIIYYYWCFQQRREPIQAVQVFGRKVSVAFGSTCLCRFYRIESEECVNMCNVDI